MEEFRIDPQEALQALQRLTSNEISRLFMEIAGRDALIEKLIARVSELESKVENG